MKLWPVVTGVAIALTLVACKSVSYTHLDVYKRQQLYRSPERPARYFHHPTNPAGTQLFPSGK